MLKQRLVEDMKTAMKAGEKRRLGVIRLINAAIKQREVDERKETTDADVLAIVDRMIKQRKDSIAQFEAGKREDLAAVERAEIAVLQAYLPAQASDAEIDAMIAEAVASTGAAGPAGIGKVMAIIKPKLAGKADMAAISARVSPLPNPISR